MPAKRPRDLLAGPLIPNAKGARVHPPLETLIRRGIARDAGQEAARFTRAAANPECEKALAFKPMETLIRGVLRLNLLASDRGDSIVGGDRRLAHPDRDQRDLAGIARDVTGRIDTWQIRLARHRVDPDLALALELEAPI